MGVPVPRGSSAFRNPSQIPPISSMSRMSLRPRWRSTSADVGGRRHVAVCSGCCDDDPDGAAHGQGSAPRPDDGSQFPALPGRPPVCGHAANNMEHMASDPSPARRQAPHERDGTITTPRQTRPCRAVPQEHRADEHHAVPVEDHDEADLQRHLHAAHAEQPEQHHRRRDLGLRDHEREQRREARGQQRSHRGGRGSARAPRRQRPCMPARIGVRLVDERHRCRQQRSRRHAERTASRDPRNMNGRRTYRRSGAAPPFPAAQWT
ncbi:hypothetical protein G1C96_0573 [Bifidobacterium sp. DSM 109958]|uniref:Uncharacterized protein n=1 Tax=Bifidobacterium moraviense TaxID=2675323 RepID=A0A7Y0F0W9_9BIFI|nr:hypothetical protein [Bifidobacterium sp. DSM 109958]